MSTQIDRISELAKEDPKRQFFSLAHLITPEALYAAFWGLRKKASAGVDGVTYIRSMKRTPRGKYKSFMGGSNRACTEPNRSAGSTSPRKMGRRDLSPSMKKRLRRGLTPVAEWCQENRHEPVDKQQTTLNAKLRGRHQYYGRPSNSRSIWQFHREVRSIWRKWLSRRTRGKGMTWEKYANSSVAIRC
jgi:hypothetical protein